MNSYGQFILGMTEFILLYSRVFLYYLEILNKERNRSTLISNQYRGFLYTIMKRTNKYGLTIYEKGDFTSSVQEMQRFETLDNQLYALFKIIGNGVIRGWNIVESTNLSVVVTSGSGHVFFVALESKNAVTVSLTAGTTETPTRNYIYASLTAGSYWTKNVYFFSSVFQNTSEEVLLLGYVDANANSVVSINTDAKQNLGFIQMVNNAIKSHRHIGGSQNPSQINLATDVQGQLNQANLPALNADVIKSGTLNAARIPTLDHTTKLSDVGTLTHAQLDEFVNILSLPNQSTMGEVSSTNLLQLILAVKHIYPDIDEDFVNEIAIIPGITPDNYIDLVNTTAIVDTNTSSQGGLHTIKGVASTGFTAYTKIWESEADFKAATSSNIIVNGDSVTLDVKENTLIIDEFDDISTWAVIMQDLSSLPTELVSDPTTYVVPPNSAKLTVGSENVEIILKISKSFDAQDWSPYNYLKFYIKTTSIEHGDLFFYVNDNTYGIQNSYTKVLDRNAPTIDIDTLENGWQEVTIDIRNLNRQNINEVGFYVSTQNGWDTSKGFSLNIDNIYLTSGNIYQNDGYIRFIFGSDFLYSFWRMRWEDVIPTDPDADGAKLSVRTRVANSEAALAIAIWTPYYDVSGYDIPIPTGEMFKYIEIEFYLSSSYTYNRSPILNRAYLDFYATDVDFSFEYSTKDAWDTGSKFNIDTNTYSNAISISNINEIGNYSYGTDGMAVQTDAYLIEKYKITGSMMPRSTYQVLNSIQPSFSTITGIVRGDSGNVWLSDIDNDRIIEVDQSGALITGFMGSFLTEPEDVYNGTLETITNSSSISVLHSIYNYNSGDLYIVCSAVLEDIYALSRKLNLNGIYLKVGGHRIYFNDADVSLLGFDNEKYNLWKGLLTSTIEESKNIKNFTFNSHVLQINPTGANRALLDNLVNQKMPSVVIASPLEQQRTSGLVTVKLLLYNFELGTTSGEQAIRITLDGGTPQIIYSTSMQFIGLSSGEHTLMIELLQSDGNPFTNIEAVANSTFVINSGTYSLPYISFTSPRANQIYSNAPVTIEFNLENFPIVPSGQHLRYTIDSGSPVDYYSLDPVTLTDLSAGKHTFNIYTVDENGDALVYDYSSATIEFIVGLNSNAVVKLYVEANSIYDLNSNSCPSYSGYVDVGNMYLRNIYSPVDVQINQYNNPITILVAKLRSPSWTEYLSGGDNLIEFVNRLTVEARALISNASSSILSSNVALSTISTANLIFNSGYLDGYSVVELDQTGKTIFSNNDAKIATTKEVAKNILGSCEKTELGGLIIADSYNKRAIIVSTNPLNRESTILWQYNSDRFVSDFHQIQKDILTISIYDGYIDLTNLNIQNMQSVMWINRSSAPISIWSGQTTYDSFYSNPDFNLYGDDFHSEVLAVGESFTFKFNTLKTYYWFIYPSILSGKISVFSQGISDQNQYAILENDGLQSAFSSRIIKVNHYGNIIWSFGESYLVSPRDIRCLANGNILIST